jgi:hypothetical protein
MVRQSRTPILNVLIGQELVRMPVYGFPVPFRLDMGKNIYLHDDLLLNLTAGLWPVP